MQSDTRNPLGIALTTGILMQWFLLLLLAWIFSTGLAVNLLAATFVVAVVAFFLWKPVAIVYALIAFGPFYDITRAFFFPGVELLGFWQDVFVGLLLLGAIRNIAREGLPKLILLDKFVIAFIATYTFSFLISVNSRIWFYGYRWFVLYPVMYLVLRTFRFTERQQRRMVAVLAVSLVLCAIIGLLELGMLGWDGIAQLDRILGFPLGGRGGLYRWAATFTSPIVASSTFALLFLAFAALLNFTKHRALCLLGCAFSVVCIYLTHSRSGVVIAACGLLAILWAARSRYFKPLLVGAVIATIFLVYQVSQTFDEFDTFRLQSFTRTITESITTYPLGTGAGTAGAVAVLAAAFAGLDSSSIDTVVGDSVILTVLRDTGWLGAVCFLGACFSAIALAWRARTSLLGMLTLAFWVGSVVNLMNSTDIYPTKLYLWLFAALAASATVQSNVLSVAD